LSRRPRILWKASANNGQIVLKEHIDRHQEKRERVRVPHPSFCSESVKDSWERRTIEKRDTQIFAFSYRAMIVIIKDCGFPRKSLWDLDFVSDLICISGSKINFVDPDWLTMASSVSLSCWLGDITLNRRETINVRIALKRCNRVQCSSIEIKRKIHCTDDSRLVVLPGRIERCRGQLGLIAHVLRDYHMDGLIYSISFLCFRALHPFWISFLSISENIFTSFPISQKSNIHTFRYRDFTDLLLSCEAFYDFCHFGGSISEISAVWNHQKTTGFKRWKRLLTAAADEKHAKLVANQNIESVRRMWMNFPELKEPSDWQEQYLKFIVQDRITMKNDLRFGNWNHPSG
jgi:hypothetical protein